MESPKILEIHNWLEKARQDLRSASWLLESPDPLFNAVGFHSQQAVEKSLKAYLTWVDHPFEKTHSLVALVGKCMAYESTFNELRMAATTLTPYAVTSRYPGELPELSFEEASKALGYAQTVWDFVLNRLPQETHSDL
jgi:HEPN domain-containing protein